MSLQILSETEEKILQDLNNKQIESVSSLEGSTLVIAGAGSGKTAVLVRRVAYLIAKGELPGNILCLTFTNKAAKEMNERVRKLLENVNINLPNLPPWQNDYLRIPLLCTFHSLGVRILREFGEEIDLKKEFTILDTEEQKKIIKQIQKDLNIDQKNLQANLVSYFISKCKQELLTPENSHKLTQDYLPVFHQIYKKYQEVLSKNQAVDFDDLILSPYLILKNSALTRQILQNRWTHIMIDEFQDTNPAQFELVKLLIPKEIL
jgi:DNA helicase II / ATP-dependent DNA helicase PcrA